MAATIVSTVEPMYTPEYRIAAEQALETALSQVPAYHGWTKPTRLLRALRGYADSDAQLMSHWIEAAC